MLDSASPRRGFAGSCSPARRDRQARAGSLGASQSDAAKLGAGGTEAIDQIDVVATDQRGEGGDAPMMLRLKFHCLRRECAGQEALSRRKQEAPIGRTGNLKLKCP
jgi:hypothetical protein